MVIMFFVCLCEGAVLPHSGREWDAQRSLWISRGQPHRTAGGETSSPRAADQPGCQVSDEEGRRLIVNVQTQSDSVAMILKLTAMIPKWAQPLCAQVWTRHPPASQTGVHEDRQCHRSGVSVSPGNSHLIVHWVHMYLNLPEWKIIVNLWLDTWRSRAKLPSYRRENWFQSESTRESLFLERRNVGWVRVTAAIEGGLEVFQRRSLLFSFVSFITVK